MTTRNPVGLTHFRRNAQWILVTPQGVKWIFDSVERMIEFAKAYWDV